jgi:hypothetical protein
VGFRLGFRFRSSKCVHWRTSRCSLTTMSVLPAGQSTGSPTTWSSLRASTSCPSAYLPTVLPPLWATLLVDWPLRPDPSCLLPYRSALLSPLLAPLGDPPLPSGTLRPPSQHSIAAFWSTAVPVTLRTACLRRPTSLPTYLLPTYPSPTGGPKAERLRTEPRFGVSHSCSLRSLTMSAALTGNRSYFRPFERTTES